MRIAAAPRRGSRGVDPVDDVRPRTLTITPPRIGPEGRRGPVGRLQERVAVREVLFGDQVGDAGEHGRAEERVRDAGDRGEHDDRERAPDERQRDEDADP